MQEIGREFDRAGINARVREGLPFTHRWHNRFHLEMPFGLINDPNGLVYYNGEYHIFYQWNPLGCEHKNKCWAHTHTRDFVTYSVPELAMHPGDVHDKDGCYSGCGTVENGQLRVLYTCNAKDEQGVRTPAQRFGVLRSDGTIQKQEIVIPNSPAGITGHFRDPYLFRRHGRRYMVLGAQAEQLSDGTPGERGTVLIYREADDGSWQNMGELATRLGDFGYMWECPGIMHFGDYDVLAFCPQGLPAREYDRQNLYESGYIAGKMSLDSMDMLAHGKFQEFDHGFDFYAPQVFQHEGRHIMLGWMGMPDRDADYPTAEQGWMYCLTLPRVLTLRQGHIYAQPARELRALRLQETAFSIDADDTCSLEADLYEGSEVIMDITLGEAQHLTLELAYGLERLKFIYDRTAQTMTIDRTDLQLGGKGVRKFRLYADEHLSLQLFVDRTAVEAFFQHGDEVASLYVFPQKNIVPELRLYSDAPMENVTGEAWELADFRYV